MVPKVFPETYAGGLGLRLDMILELGARVVGVVVLDGTVDKPRDEAGVDLSVSGRQTDSQDYSTRLYIVYLIQSQ